MSTNTQVAEVSRQARELSRRLAALERIVASSAVDTSGLATDSELAAAAAALAESDVPIGGEITYWGSTEPASGDWKFPNGQAISRADYPDAFTLWGTTYGAGDGSTTFNIPDGRGRARVQRDASAGVLTGTDTLGTTGGEQRVTLAATESGVAAHGHTASVTINNNTTNLDHHHTEHFAKLVNHYHTNPNTNSDNGFGGAAAGSGVNRANATHAHSQGTTSYVAAVSGYAYGPEIGNTGYVNDGSADGTWNVTHGHTGTVTVNNATAAAASSSHENMPPHVRVNRLVRVR